MSVSGSSCQGKTGILTEEFDPGQVVFETLHSGGKDGQNVNKVETEVRAIYLPAGGMRSVRKNGGSMPIRERR